MSDYRLTEEEFQTVLQQLDALVQEFEQLPFPEVREMVFDLLKAVDAIHREGVERLVTFLRDQGQSELLERAATDPIIRSLLLLYELIPGEEFGQLEVAQPQVNFIPLDQLLQEVSPRPRQPVFKDVAPVEQVPVDIMRDFEVEGIYVLVANVAGKIHAVRGHCPGSMAPLHLGSFSPPVIICPWHNEAYDVRTGERVDGPEYPKLETIPVAINGGIIQVAVNGLADTALKP